MMTMLKFMMLCLCLAVVAPSVVAASAPLGAPSAAHAQALRHDVTVALRAVVSAWLTAANSPHGAERRRRDLIVAVTQLSEAQAKAAAFDVRLDRRQEAALSQAAIRLEDAMASNPDLTQDQRIDVFVRGLIVGYASVL